MDKRYQVFVSSTYKDLQEERKEIMQALLELDCMPSGMELFPATNDDQWTLIKSVIDDSDYYIVVLGGRYGSIGPQGISYTEMEYRYAIEVGKPTIAFIHKDPQELPNNRTEQEKEGKEKLELFRTLTQQKLVRYWSNPIELGSVVSRSLTKLIKSNPAIGWVRADKISDDGASKEILRLKNQVDRLKDELDQVKVKAPEKSEEFAQGEDLFQIVYTFTGRKKGAQSYYRYKRNLIWSWNKIFQNVGPLLMNEASEEDIIELINKLIYESEYLKIANDESLNMSEASNFTLDSYTFQTIKVQLRVLGLINRSMKQRSVNDTAAYWTLTPYGDEILLSLRAIRRIHLETVVTPNKTNDIINP
ncbi:DUF4062 domain-containing protein [Paenibacillus sp. FSL H8-0261]|uniref:DUF4062 domain-containing protein n=1 Tax=Paenibacillus sp. FSL H8-0261 TaxID=2921381 RepID=UPI00324EFEE5